MVELYREVSRLVLLSEDLIGQEALLYTRLTDLVSYFFKRFLVNIKSISKPFAQSELQNFLMRYPGQSDVMFKDPLSSLRDVLLPIPKGMQKTYKETLNQLKSVLEIIVADQIKEDLQTLIGFCKDSESKIILSSPKITKKKYDFSKDMIGKLYSNKGLSNVPGSIAFKTFDDISEVKRDLLELSQRYYTQVIEIHALVSQINELHSESVISKEQIESVKNNVLDLAYRVSIFAVVMNHIQEMEHAFVKCLNILVKRK